MTTARVVKITEPNGELSVAVYVGNALYSYFPFNQQTVKTAIDYVKGLKTPPKVEVIHEELIP